MYPGNNCTRGGFICEGYANKIPWPKNGLVKPQPALQSKERPSGETSSTYSACPVCSQAHAPHCEGRRSSQPPYTKEPMSHLASRRDGARSRPIAIEEERKLSTSSSWSSSGWSENAPPPSQPQPRASYSSEPHTYAQPPSIPAHERPTAHERSVPHAQQSEPSRQQHSSRVYHHTPQSMSQGVSSSLAPVV